MVTLRELEADARRRLDPAHYDYFAGGACDEVTVRRNEAAFARVHLVPRVLRSCGARALNVTLLGCAASMPVFIAPTAFHRLAHPDGERATARAAAAAEVVMIVSMASTVAIGDVAAAARESAVDPHLWFQVYIQSDLGFTEAVIRRAEAAGCKALVVTVDSPVLGRRERDARNGFVDLPPGMCCENLRDDSGGGPGMVRPIEMFAGLSWEHVDWLRATTALPVVVKGILHPADAAIAVEHDIDALIVSNHGGRQLDTVPAAVEQLPRIADAIGGRLPLLVDGGIRRGTDVAKALALGATAVGIGRPAIWGLTVAGEAGVTEVLETLRAELAETLALCGCHSPDDLSRDLVRIPVMEDGCCPS
jgi:4-hydroxymandelate oxidase